MTSGVRHERPVAFADDPGDGLEAVRGSLRSIALSDDHSSAASVETVRYWTGQSWQLGSAAYWEAAAAQAVEPQNYRLGSTLAEEVGACLLGGYGMPFRLANAAFERLRHAGTFDPGYYWSPGAIEQLLSPPLEIDGRLRRYRFPRQRGARISQALAVLETVEEPEDDLALRDLLLSIPGIGPKTASWVVRNHRGSNSVAIIDIHLVRAGLVAGVFRPTWRLPRDYGLYERAFLGWARQAGVQPRLLDAYIWGALAYDPSAARDILGFRSTGSALRPVWPTAR
jgi:hypothetical protein